MTRDPARSVRWRVIAVGAILPGAIVVVAALAMLSWLPELPDPVATHWGPGGVDGFGPAWPLMLLPLGIVVIVSGLALGTAWESAVDGAIGWSHKFLLVIGVWLSCFIGVGVAGSLVDQRGLAEAADAPDPGRWLGIGGAAGLVLAAAAWFVLPKARALDDEGVEPEPLEVSASERVFWSRGTRFGWGVLTLIGVVLLVVLGVTTVAAATADGSARFAVAAIAVVIAVVIVAVLATGWWWVTVDWRGLIVRSLIGWPRISIPLDGIRSVRTVRVNPSEFGGWGWRWTPGRRSGIIMRAGEAIEVVRTDGRQFTVTVDDAGTGSAALAGLLARTDQRGA